MKRFSRFFLFSLLLWAFFELSVIFATMPVFQQALRDQAFARLRTNAVILNEYFSSLRTFENSTTPQIDLLCKSLGKPQMLDTRITLFSPQAEILGDSRVANPGDMGNRDRPEVNDAVHESVGQVVRYSPVMGGTMAFLAFPHVQLGEVKGVIRVGIPLSSLALQMFMSFMNISMIGVALSFMAAASLYFLSDRDPTFLNGLLWGKRGSLR